MGAHRPGFRQQLGGFDAFRGAMSTLRSIEFRRLDTLAQSTGAAEVAIETVARHTDRVDHCRGTLRVLRGAGGGWQIGGAGVGCSSDAGAP
jgi:hypothetical protein